MGAPHVLSTALVRSVIELATKVTCNLPDTIKMLRGRLQEVIGQKRSVVVVTCRNQQVESIMDTLGPHKLACLSEDDSWELFSKKSFSNGVEERAELVAIGKHIVKKCRGLPLALKTMGGLMSSKQLVQEWEVIEESSIGDNGTMDLTQKAESIFRDLVWRSFLQDVKTKKLYSVSTRYEEIGCKMHDLMHDLAKDVTDEYATIEELIQQKAMIKDVRHMTTVYAWSEEEHVSSALKDTVSLRTVFKPLILPKNLKESGPESLRVLCCWDPSIIHNQVINGKLLRYLDLSMSGIIRMPNSICLLYNLQSLRLNGCSLLQQLPEGMSTMRKLIHLYLFGCDSLERMPPNIGLLHNLHTLTNFVVDIEVGCGIKELKDLRHLSNRLERYNLRKVKNENNAKEANLHQKQNITELLMR
uniref:Putative disease resistance protein RGA4 n=1 Tax=Aegilops tauschii TaxID=37682 RepID=N1QR12_AEGTA